MRVTTRDYAACLHLPKITILTIVSFPDMEHTTKRLNISEETCVVPDAHANALTLVVRELDRGEGSQPHNPRTACIGTSGLTLRQTAEEDSEASRVQWSDVPFSMLLEFCLGPTW
ncbi:uncharacterized protein TRIREDRAFT_112277 [Trichoderma reesei QM6a]|uniref:Predicted protein n=2 Tax=Hypocrea jecorina TaxID=51453 RepID=G0RWN1_HYPJQ|nr:uncharacterized protein TRIREDRAFT_112277 [Trichoderma reesei QM6a]EGR44380.1 predicted protein [Trichoderma reesei QM6a]ETR97088.1 hypothetical protein M419DRAFT_92595 [Trichoderma reesei RUT C-30]